MGSTVSREQLLAAKKAAYERLRSNMTRRSMNTVHRNVECMPELQVLMMEIQYLESNDALTCEDIAFMIEGPEEE